MQRGSPCRRMPTSRTQPSGHRIASCNFRAAGNTNRNEGRSAGKIEKSKIVRGKGRKKMHNRGRNDRGTTVIKRPTRTSQIKAHRDDARDREKKSSQECIICWVSAQKAKPREKPTTTMTGARRAAAGLLAAGIVLRAARIRMLAAWRRQACPACNWEACGFAACLGDSAGAAGEHWVAPRASLPRFRRRRRSRCRPRAQARSGRPKSKS